MSQPAHETPALSETEEALLDAFRQLRSAGRTAVTWRTLGKFASAKALEEEREYEAKFMGSVPGQMHLKIGVFDHRLIDRLHTLRETLKPPPPGVRDYTRQIHGGHHALERLCYDLMLKGLAATEWELGLNRK